MFRSEKCKSRVLMVYCGFQFDRMGKCVPPFLVKPGNVPWNGTDVWSGSAYPEPGSRPSTQVLQRFKLLDKYKHKNLVPVRIGFALLVHKDVPAILQLLRVIYRPYNFYVLHVDYRKVWSYRNYKRNWVFATNSNFLTPLSFQPDGVNLWYFKLNLFNLTEFISLKYPRLQRYRD